MTKAIKSLVAGIAATPFILLMTIGIGLACRLNPHFLLVSVLITNIFGVILNRKSTNFFNITVGLIALMVTYHDSIGIESGLFQTFIIFLIPASIFFILSCFSVNYILVPNRALAILTFGLGIAIILKQLPTAFAYLPSRIDSSLFTEVKSFLDTSTMRNWIQFGLALLIPLAGLIGHRFRKGIVALLLATFVSIGLGYLMGYDTTALQSETLLFNEPFQLNWTFSKEVLFTALANGVSITFVMLIGFWADFSTLNYDQRDNKVGMKKSLRILGSGNFISGLFGVMPANISLIDSFIIRAFGGKGWISKLPVILTLLVVAIIGIPNFHVPLYSFAGIIIYIGIILVIKSWNLLKSLHWIDYVFTIIIGTVIVLQYVTIGFFLAIIYALVFYLITQWKDKIAVKDR